MNEADKELVKSLEGEAGLPSRWAFPFVRYRGRCAYCGQDLLVDRQGYATAQIDHLLPQASYPEYTDEQDNWVLSCNLCNHTKRDWDPLKDRRAANPLVLLRDDKLRARLIAGCRTHIRNQRAEEVDEEWRTVKKILGYP